MFKKKYKSPPEDFVRWVNASIFFLRHNLSYADIRTLKKIILPSNRIFSFNPSSKSFYDDLFEKVKELMDIEDRNCRLFVENNGIDNVLLDTGSPTHTPAGTFASDRYDAEIVLTINRYTDIENVLATLSHELSHYKIHRLRNYVPDEMDEPLTDLYLSRIRNFHLEFFLKAENRSVWLCCLFTAGLFDSSSDLLCHCKNDASQYGRLKPNQTAYIETSLYSY